SRKRYKLGGCGVRKGGWGMSMRAMLVATIGAIFLSGCVREDTESQFCRAVGARADGGVVLMDDVRLYVAGGVGHGAVVFDPACREQVSDLLIDYRPEA